MNRKNLESKLKSVFFVMALDATLLLNGQIFTYSKENVSYPNQYTNAEEEMRAKALDKARAKDLETKRMSEFYAGEQARARALDDANAKDLATKRMSEFYAGSTNSLSSLFDKFHMKSYYQPFKHDIGHQ